MARRLEQNGMGIIQPRIGLGALATILASTRYMAEVGYAYLPVSY